MSLEINTKNEKTEVITKRVKNLIKKNIVIGL